MIENEHLERREPAMSLADKSAIITGGGSGIGRATALLFSREGAALTIADVDERGGAATESEIRKEGGRVIFVKSDVSIAADAKRIVERHIAAFGGLDVLFNDAAVQLKGTVLTLSEQQWDAMMNVNVKGIFLLSREALPFLAKRKGAIINMASVSGIKTMPNWAAYSASKAAVVQLTKAMAVDHADLGVRTNCICPGPIETPALMRNNSDEERKKQADSLPLKRFGRPEEIARVALFLATPDSSYMTGSAFVIDGGALST